MSYRMMRTSMSLDVATVETMDALAKLWSVSKAEVLRRAVRRLKEETEKESSKPAPLQALDWLQGGGGLSVKEGEEFKKAIRAERNAKRYWWEA